MRQAGTFDSRPSAQRLADYLLTQGVATHVAQEGNEWALWVEDDEHLERVKHEIEAFKQDPNAPRYRASTGPANAIRKQEEKEARWAKRNYIDVRTRWARSARGRRPLTLALIGICVLVAILTGLGKKPEPVMNWLMIASYQIPGHPWMGLTQIRDGQIWRLITPIFIHFGILHIVFDMWWLYDLGTLIEVRRGSAFFALLVVVTAVLSNLGQYFLAGPGFGGMSGVVYGLFGYMWLKGHFEPKSGMALPQITVVIMLGWLVLCMVGVIGDIANGAHVVGLAVGCAAGAGPTVWRRLAR